MPLEQLRPSARRRVMDLVEEAGIDVASWAFKGDGTRVVHPAANPAYCYDWCFEDGKRVVLSLWFEEMRLENSRIVQRINVREHQRRVERATHLAEGTRKAVVRRAVKLDSAIQRAFREELLVRVIVCDGDRRDIGNTTRRNPSRVERRLLDPSSWHVTAYDNPTGKTVLVRDR
jgi:5-methylcytosine-specific restriction protein A